MTPEAQRIAIAKALGYELLVIDYWSFEQEPGLTRGADGVWRTPSGNKWAKQIEAQNVKCVGRYFVRLSDQQIFADFDGPDTGDNRRGQFDWLHDLNAIHAAVLTLSRAQYWIFVIILHEITNGKGEIAEANQVCIAYLRAIGKWVE